MNKFDCLCGKFNKTTFFITLIFTFIWLVLMGLLLVNYSNNNMNFLFFLTNLIILLLSIYNLFLSPHISLYFIFFLFSFLAFGVAPFFQVYENIRFWGETFLGNKDFIFSNLIIILGIFSFIFGYFTTKVDNKVNNKHNTCCKNARFLFLISKHKFRVKCFLAILLAISIYLIFYFENFNLYLVLFRGINGKLFSISNVNNTIHSTTFYLIYEHIVKPLPIMITIIWLWYCKNFPSISNKFFAFILLSAALICVSPLSVARYLSITLYLTLILMLFDNLVLKKYYFHFIGLLSSFVVLPFLNCFRHFSGRINLSFNFNYLLTANFDPYQNFSSVVHYNIVTYGRQLLGSLLFFIPRSIWTSKPVGSGTFIANKLNLLFSNISMPFLGEGYINFGILGVFIFMFSLGAICSILDKRFYSLKFTLGIRYHYYYPFYYFCLGLLIFVLRGDFLSSFSYSISLLLLWVALFKITLLLARIKL